jgi:outer membrane protein assembly factor BamB
LNDGRLYVAGMRDHLVCLDAATGKVIWDVDFVKALKTPVPDFGFVSSPLVVGDAVYVQAAAALVKLDKRTGEVKWRALEDKGGMWGSAFSSPLFARLAGQDQLVVQSREKLAGIHPETGAVLWEQPIKAFRGMNILTPLVQGDRLFTSAYGGQAHQFEISRQGDAFAVTEVWAVKAEAYMSSPLLIDDHIYLHLRNQRFVCLDWKTGEQRWESEKKFGQYWSLVANGRQILALDEDRKLHLIKASPERFELIASQKVADEESWAHLAVSGDEIFVRDLKGVTAFKWQAPAAKVIAN